MVKNNAWGMVLNHHNRNYLYKFHINVQFKHFELSFRTVFPFSLILLFILSFNRLIKRLADCFSRLNYPRKSMIYLFLSHFNFYPYHFRQFFI